MITHIIFDNNGVLTTNDEERTYSRVSEFLGISIEEEKKILGKFVLSLDEGKITQREFYYKFLREGNLKHDIDKFAQVHLESYIPKKEVQEFASSLKKNYSIVLLSNFGDAFWKLYPQWGLAKLILRENVFVSSDMGMAKPDEKIYLKMLNRLKVEANKCVFIDDNKDNILTASRLGFHALHFTQLEELKDNLRDLGVIY